MLYPHTGGENEVVAGEKFLKKHRHRPIRDLLYLCGDAPFWRGRHSFYDLELVY
jgi:hypothetical protein